MSKRLPSNTSSKLVEAAINATLPVIEAPAHVRIREQDAPFWVDIIKSRAREEWAKSDLVVAAQLARCQSDIEAESLQLEAEGSVIENNRGTPVMNPRHAVLEQLSRREMALMRSLQMVGSAKGDKRDVEKARKLQRQADMAQEEVTDDDLLA